MITEKIKIVVVDDVPDVADTLAMQLELAGFLVVTAYSAERAIIAIEEHQPACVLFDIDMPDIDGYELAELLHHGFKRDIVLIAITGSDKAKMQAAKKSSLVDHYFLKPVDVCVLSDIIRDHLKT